MGSTQILPHVLSFLGNADGMVLTDCTNLRVGRVPPALRPRASTALNSYTLTVEESSFTTYAALMVGWKALYRKFRMHRRG